MKSARPSGSADTAVWVVVGWTLFMWATRTRLIFTEKDLSLGDVIVRVLPVFLFVALALTLVAGLRTGRPDLPRLVAVTAVWTSGYWLVRITLIVIHDHSVGFKAIHVVLAIISTVAVVWAWWQTSGRALRGAPNRGSDRVSGGGRRGVDGSGLMPDATTR